MRRSRRNPEGRDQELSDAAESAYESFKVRQLSPEGETGRSRIYPEHWMIAAVVCCAFIVAIVRLTNLA